MITVKYFVAANSTDDATDYIDAGMEFALKMSGIQGPFAYDTPEEALKMQGLKPTARAFRLTVEEVQ